MELKMKLRIVIHNREKFILCPNGTKMKVDKKALNKLVVDFKNPTSFKGKDGRWNMLVSDMEDAAGETLAFVDDELILHILNNKLFTSLVSNYIPTLEYAEKHGKTPDMVKKLCVSGRIEGAYKTSAGWMIPSDAPYPKRKPREVKK